LPVDFIKREPDATRWEQHGVEIFYGKWYLENWKKWLVDNAKSISKIYFMDDNIAEKRIMELNEVMGEKFKNIAVNVIRKPIIS